MTRKTCAQCAHLHYTLNKCLKLHKGVTAGYSACVWFKSRRIKRFLEWLYVINGRIAIIKGFNNFIIDSPTGQRTHIWPVWNWARVRALIYRPFRCRPKKKPTTRIHPWPVSHIINDNPNDTSTRSSFNAKS